MISVQKKKRSNQSFRISNVHPKLLQYLPASFSWFWARTPPNQSLKTCFFHNCFEPKWVQHVPQFSWLSLLSLKIGYPRITMDFHSFFLHKMVITGRFPHFSKVFPMFFRTPLPSAAWSPGSPDWAIRGRCWGPATVALNAMKGQGMSCAGWFSAGVLQNGCLMDMIWQMDLQIFNGYLRKMNISWILVLNIENEDFMDS